MDNIYSVQIIDDETSNTYRINLTHEEYEKAITDKEFLNDILTKVKDGTIPSTSPQQGLIEARESNVEEPTDSWTTEGTLSFITEYEILQQQIEKGKLKQKAAFEQISHNLQQKNFLVTAKQCATKLASLKRTYKKIKDHNNRSGNDRQTWQYFQRMENIFCKKPWIQPVALCSSRSEEDDPEQETTEEVPAFHSNRKRQSSVENKLDELLEENKRRRIERGKQHAEKMERLDKLLEILERRKD